VPETVILVEGRASPEDTRAGFMNRTSKTEPFFRHHQRYDQWFERHWTAYASELLAVHALLPGKGRGLEIGVGTGRFAAPLGVEFGVDPVPEMLRYARTRGTRVVCAAAEALPFADGVFDYVLVVTTLCFVENPQIMLHEAARVLRSRGKVVIGFIDRRSPLGNQYVAHRAESPFYREARFYSALEVRTQLRETGFSDLTWVQTLYTPLSRMKAVEPVSTGTGRGAFLVVRAQRP
jgi:SAM-dependent methyltransferase